jgi:diguanylate cyclase (GGDEF)-like protein
MAKKSTPPPRSAVKARRKAASGSRANPRSAAAGDSRAVAAGPKRTIRRLKAELAAALAKIEELRASADTDGLLGILNRRGFERELNRSVAYIRRYQASGALIMLDVDRLKPINDRFGHAAGDEVLKAVVEVLLRHVRASDLVGRLGGDEFMLLLWNMGEADAAAKALALEAAIDQLQFSFAGEVAHAGVSAGVAMLTAGTEIRQAMEQADRAMYARKAVRRALHEAAPAVAREALR